MPDKASPSPKRKRSDPQMSTDGTTGGAAAENHDAAYRSAPGHCSTPTQLSSPAPHAPPSTPVAATAESSSPHQRDDDDPAPSSTSAQVHSGTVDLAHEVLEAENATDQTHTPAAPIQPPAILQRVKPEPRPLSAQETTGLQEVRRLLVGVIFSDIQGLKALRDNNFDVMNAANAIQEFLLQLEEARTGDRVRLASETSRAQHQRRSHEGGSVPMRSILIRQVPSLESLLQQHQDAKKAVSREEDEMIARLHDMGFPDSTCRLAATHCPNNFQHALEWALAAGAVGIEDDPIDLTGADDSSVGPAAAPPEHYDAALQLLELEGKALKWYKLGAEAWLRAAAVRLNCRQLDSEILRSEAHTLKTAMYSMPAQGGQMPDAFHRALEEERAAAGGPEFIVIE